MFRLRLVFVDAFDFDGGVDDVVGVCVGVGDFGFNCGVVNEFDDDVSVQVVVAIDFVFEIDGDVGVGVCVSCCYWW